MGRDHAGVADVGSWTEILLGYADLQRSLMGCEAELLDIGCPDLRPHPAVDRFEQMMERGHAPEHRWLIDAARHVAGQIDMELIPATIHHDDLRPDNVFRNGRVFDWGDASLAHRFATLLTALMPNRADRPGTAAEKAEMRDAYLRSWQRTGEGVRSLERLREQARLGCVPAPIGRIDTWLRAPSSALGIHPDAVNLWVQHMLETDWS